MAARNGAGAGLGVTPSLSILQLDTHFPRIPGDVACPQTYTSDVEIIRTPGAAVRGIVRQDPAAIDIAPFAAALNTAKGKVIATSCGFLSYWQDHLQSLTAVPFISSALISLPRLARTYSPDQLMIVTFDADALGPAHLAGAQAYQASLVGLPAKCILRCAIAEDLSFDPHDVTRELVALVQRNMTAKTRHILFECTNLPPYSQAIRTATGLPVTSILSEIEKAKPGLVNSAYL